MKFIKYYNFKYILLLLFFSILLGTVYIKYTKSFAGTRFSFTFTDILIYYFRAYFMNLGLFPLIQYVFFPILAQVFNPNVVICHKSFRQIWFSYVRRVALLSFILSTLIIIVLGIVAYYEMNGWINFMEKTSLFSYYNNGITLNDLSVYSVILLAWKSMFFVVFFIGLFESFLIWAGVKPQYVFVLLYAANIGEAYLIKNGIFFQRIQISYQTFITDNNSDIIATAAFVLVVVAGMTISSNKDLINENV